MYIYSPMFYTTFWAPLYQHLQLTGHFQRRRSAPKRLRMYSGRSVPHRVWEGLYSAGRCSHFTNKNMYH